jgi:AmmeMemoRadiSam system protein B
LWPGISRVVISSQTSVSCLRQTSVSSTGCSDRADIGRDDACGHLPIGGLLIEAKGRGVEALRLDLRESGDTAGPRDRIVRYGAWAFLPTVGEGGNA